MLRRKVSHFRHKGVLWFPFTAVVSSCPWAVKRAQKTAAKHGSSEMGDRNGDSIHSVCNRATNILPVSDQTDYNLQKFPVCLL